MKSLESLVECSSAGKAAAEAQASELQETVKGLKLETSRLEAALAASKEKVGSAEGGDFFFFFEGLYFQENFI